ncbi:MULTISPECIES: DUF305 domain-containing protein [Rhodobacterales]|uniref:DUF305 domain-containing protein n=2 Tax=Roseobacteraceae TaxID=2854170 RepID=A0A2T0WCL1_9RHOB|nr:MULTISPECIES: DUF305 domain-containing protein [Roseobacteraceae]MEC8666487.1 DUF305 domain-containing protein [Pseudomonadota bacterium]PRY84443.1 protein of unknown function (DUF305) [Donghicola tyrosinivorans]CUH81875.1 hypothetical protein TRN7648_03683 [Tropicibacter naphthalenivorans]SMD02196.1 protein of unknown function [Tropicibacter naphthalenivorans]
MKYSRFFLMIGTSTLVMFVLMYLNTYLLGHVFFSETRAWMAVLMGATMAFVMLSFMLSMYTNKALNAGIFVGSVVVFALSLWLVRSQVTVQDRSFMRAMIPHHSIAIMTSSRAEITDPRVATLAEAIVYAQDKEIAEMRYLIADISANGEADPTGETAAPEVVDARQALSTEVTATVDPEFLTADDITKALPEGATCRFTYTATSPAVLAVGKDAAVMKISGDLVRLDRQGDGFAADPLSAELHKGDDLTDLIVTAGPDYSAGFRGQYTCEGGQ